MATTVAFILLVKLQGIKLENFKLTTEVISANYALHIAPRLITVNTMLWHLFYLAASKRSLIKLRKV